MIASRGPFDWMSRGSFAGLILRGAPSLRIAFSPVKVPTIRAAQARRFAYLESPTAPRKGKESQPNLEKEHLGRPDLRTRLICREVY